MTTRAPLTACVALAVVCALPALARADGDARPALFVGTTHGGDAQLNPGLTALSCPACPHVPAATSMAEAPTLATIGLSLSGRERSFRGGLEAFTTVAATGQTSGYAGVLTYAGLELGRVYGVAGLGWGTFYGGFHSDVISAMAGIARTELGVHVAHGFSIVVRTDVLKNNLSSTRTASLGISWMPQ